MKKMKKMKQSLFALGRLSGLTILILAVGAMAQAPGFQPVGSVHQIMLGIVKPSSDVIFAVPAKAPKDDKEWETVQNNALMLAEAGNLLLIPGRAKDNGEWVTDANALIKAGSDAFKAANAKHAKALETIGDNIEDTCEKCHGKYLPQK
jgi:hypothetical protein